MRKSDEVPTPTPAAGVDKHGKLRTVTGTFQATMQLTQARSLMVTGHLYSDDTAAELNGRIDMAQDAIERQAVRCEIANKEQQIKGQVEAIAHFRDQLEDLRARQNPAGHSPNAPRPAKLSSQEKLALENGARTILKAEESIEKLQGEIAEARKKLEGVEARA